MAKKCFLSFTQTFFLCIVTLFALRFIQISARPATFNEDFKVAWSESHIRKIDGGKSIQLVLDQSTGCGFASKRKYLFGRVSMKIKLIPGDSAGTVTAFYMNSDTDTVRDELDFEFLGNRNDVPIREYKNNEAKKIAYPTTQPMGVYSTLWEADDWATRGGLEKIDWSKAPFNAYYKDFDIEGCPVPGPTLCPSNTHNWWEGYAYQSLNDVEARRYRWVRLNHMVYDYCTDRSRYPVPPIECRV
ncbi:unnamed protein product [Cochlearia groenlandica]